MLLLSLAACTNTSSSEVLTSEVYASIGAEASGNGKTVVSATLYVDSPLTLNFVELAAGESLVATAAGVSKTLQAREVLNTIVHRAELDIDAPGTMFEIAFERDVDAGAPRSLATLPAAFDLATPPATMSRAAPLTLTWAPAGSADGMAWLATGDCIENAIGTITGDPGTVTIAADRLTKRMGTTIADTCAVTFTIQRTRAGLLDEHFRDGVISGTQARAAVISSTP